MRVEQLMRSDVHTVAKGASLERAVMLMAQYNCGCVPVVDQARHIVGIVTDRDVCMAVLREKKLLQNIAVDEVMSTKVHVCSTEDSVAYVAHLMESTGVRRLPVLDEDETLAGIISLYDLANEASREVGSTERDLLFSDLGRTLLAVSGSHAA